MAEVALHGYWRNKQYKFPAMSEKEKRKKKKTILCTPD
jgi:hypothetical protein